MAAIDDLQDFASRGWAIFPCHSIVNRVCSCGDPECDSAGKHPRTHNGVKAATHDLAQIEAWWGQYPGCNWGLACGAASGVVVIDLDVKQGVDGRASFEQYCDDAQIEFSPTFEVRTGGGGWHLYFKQPDQPIGNRVNWLPGVDVRADRGYVLLPGSNHVTGQDYVVERDTPPTLMPHAIADAILKRHSPSRERSIPSDWTAGFVQGERDDGLFRVACKLRRNLNDDRAAITVLVLAAAANSTPPFPEKEALKKIEQAFAQDHSDELDLSRVPFAAPGGLLYDFLGDLEPGMIPDIEKVVRGVKVRGFAARVLREERVAKYGDAASLDGASFMFGESATYSPIWGAGDRILWAEGGGLMIASDQGLGKSFTAQQIIAARLGVGPGDLLGLPIEQARTDRGIVYLALDRPVQIARSMARLFREPLDREAAAQRLQVWTKPVPIDLVGDPVAFADWLAETFGESIGDLVIDSVKDLTPANLSNGEIGQALDMAWKECRARGMNTLVLHHERKTGNDSSRANRQPSLDHIYGSVWLTSGMDSILHIQGKQGENVVTYTHLKHIIEGIEPVTAMHDQEHGRTDVIKIGEATDKLDRTELIFEVVKRHAEQGEAVSVAGIVVATGMAQATVNRHIKRLRDSGRIEEATPYVKATGTAATFRAA